MSAPATDGHVSAHYGFSPASLSFDGRDGAMSYEGIARWAPSGSLPNGLPFHGGENPARLRWCLYPGHGVVRPYGDFDEYGKTISWKNYMGEHPVANGDSGA